MTNIFNHAWKKLLNIFGITNLVIRTVDNITNANTKQKMFMDIFSLHAKYFDIVDFDYLFLDILDTTFNNDFYDNHISYFDIASEIIANNRISENELRNVLLNWIYDEPFFRHQLMIEIPQAVVEAEPLLVEATMV